MKKMIKTFELSVHDLVDFLLRRGDIDNRIYNKATMQEGTLVHSSYQIKQGINYQSEYFLKEKFDVDEFSFSIEGRADGVYLSGDLYYVEEIKSTTDDLLHYFESQKEWHLGQAKCYALMLAHERNLAEVGIQLTYISQLNRKIKLFKRFTFKTEELEQYVDGLFRDYLSFYKLIYNRGQKRNKSAEKLPFPFASFRSGQRTLAKYSYGVANDGGILFCEAPTGIGKTISTLYPCVKSFANGENEKIFYLTAKNSGKEAAHNAVSLMSEKGLFVSEIIITAKDKICPFPDSGCNPDECPYAKDYYTKLRYVLTKSVKTTNSFTADKILEIAHENAMCPFELSLDLSLLVDIIICDYNYFFDPFVYLKRYFDTPMDNALVLVDEAHNLVERGRNMYSASLSRGAFYKARKCLRLIDHPKIKTAAKKLSKFFDSYEWMEGESKIGMFPRSVLMDFDKFNVAATDVARHFSKELNDDFKNFAFDLSRFSHLLNYYDSSFALCIRNNQYDLVFNLLCLDPREFLADTLAKVKGKIIFSATLSPADYYIRMIGGEEDNPMLTLSSPFDKNNLCLMVAPKLSVRYKDRDNTYSTVAKLIKTVIESKVGNYFIYAPSFEYLLKLLPLLEFDDVKLIVQEKEMSEKSKSEFLNNFVENPKKTTVGLVVVGGAFGEGIDLLSDRLIGVIIIGVGLPQICFEREQIREYFDLKEESGFVYSYINPGINKIMQAVGRVIRSEKDRGVALLIDDRYLNATYHDLFNNHWSNYKVVTTIDDIKSHLNKFWKQ